MATEDIDYNVAEFATSEDKKQLDPDQPNKSVLFEVQKYLKKAIVEYNTVDGIDLTEAAKMTPTQQIAVHKLVVNHLRSVKRMVDDKLKEL
jgi:hypothetical protein